MPEKWNKTAKFALIHCIQIDYTFLYFYRDNSVTLPFLIHFLRLLHFLLLHYFILSFLVFVIGARNDNINIDIKAYPKRNRCQTSKHHVHMGQLSLVAFCHIEIEPFVAFRPMETYKFVSETREEECLKQVNWMNRHEINWMKKKKNGERRRRGRTNENLVECVTILRIIFID